MAGCFVLIGKNSRVGALCCQVAGSVQCVAKWQARCSGMPSGKNSRLDALCCQMAGLVHCVAKWQFRCSVLPGGRLGEVGCQVARIVGSVHYCQVAVSVHFVTQW